MAELITMGLVLMAVLYVILLWVISMMSANLEQINDVLHDIKASLDTIRNND